MSSPPNIQGKPTISVTLSTMQQQSQMAQQRLLNAGVQITAFIAPPADDTTTQYADPTLSDTVSQNSLVGYWPFVEASGVLTDDYSSEGHNGTLHNAPTWVSGKFGSGLKFDGSTNYVETSAAPAISSQITLSAWINIPLLSGGPGSTYFGGQYESIMMIQSATAQLSVHISTDGTIPNEHNYGGSSGPILNDGAWHLLVATYDGTNYNGYVDGIKVFSVAGLQFYTTLNNVWIGANSFGGYTNASFSECRIYNLAASDGGVSVGQAAAAGSQIYYLYNQVPRSLPNDSAAPPSSTTESVSDSISPSDSELVNGPFAGYCFDSNIVSPAKTAAQLDIGSKVSNSDIVGGELDL